MKLDQWLDREIGVNRGGTLERSTVIKELVRLIIMNGGKIQVTAWGQIAMGGPYGRMGLEMVEALELIKLGGIIDGFVLGEGEDSGIKFKERIQKEIDKVVKDGLGEGPEGLGKVIEVYGEAEMKKVIEEEKMKAVAGKKLIMG